MGTRIPYLNRVEAGWLYVEGQRLSTKVTLEKGANGLKVTDKLDFDKNVEYGEFSGSAVLVLARG
ncbi:hypothetical protein [Achromobacter sp. UMC46]|uniref:hypothetical protein n=1 Tax=Achromobacter sp. UMC46 TaxID=1862319 RepID=UPI001C8172A1|nr:hypothetical protein [Achromobacter sp. UMC46]